MLSYRLVSLDCPLSARLIIQISKVEVRVTDRGARWVLAIVSAREVIAIVGGELASGGGWRHHHLAGCSVTQGW